MDYDKACKRLYESEEHDIEKVEEADVESYDSELEEGEVREEDEPPRSESAIQKHTAAGAMVLSSSAQEAVEKEQVNIKQSTSPERAPDQGGAASIVAVQQSECSVIHKDMAASSIELSSAQGAIEKDQINIVRTTSPERGSHQGETTCTSVLQQSNCSAIHKNLPANAIELSSSAQGAFEKELATSPERGSYQGGTASAVACEGRHVNARQSTLHITCSEKHCQSHPPSVYSSSKERHKQRKKECFRYSDYRWVLRRVEEVCSERFSKLLSRQNGDCEKFKIVRKEQELEFFKEHVHAFKLHYEHVMPTIRYCRMKLPKLHFCILRERFDKHVKSQLMKFVKQQINGRNKENRMKKRWIFEAEAGYLKKCFYVASLSYSEFKMGKLEWPMTDCSDGEEHLKCFDMQSLASQIEAIAPCREPEDTFSGKASDVCEPALEILPSGLETNEAKKDELSVGVAEEMDTLESRSSQSTCAPAMEFGEQDGTQLSFSPAAAQNEGAMVERSYDSLSVSGAVLEPATAVTANKASDVSDPILRSSPLMSETNGATELGHVAVAEEMAALENSSSQFTCAQAVEFGEKDGAHIASSAAAQNEGQNTETHYASQPVTGVALELSMAVTIDSENASPTYRQKRRRISSSNDISEGPCSRSCGTSPCESTSNLLRKASCHEERPVARPHQVNTNQTTQVGDAGNNEVPTRQTYSFVQAIEQPNMHSNTQSAANQHNCGSTCRTGSHPYQPPGENAHSVRTTVDRLGASNAQPTSENQVPTGSTPEQCLVDDGLQTHPLIIESSRENQVPTGSTPEQCLVDDGLQTHPLRLELTRILTLREQIKKSHIEKREQIILSREIEMAQIKRKYEELVYNSDIEFLQQKKNIETMCDKIYKQQILAEALQVMYKPPAAVIPDSRRCPAQRTMAELNQSSDQHVFQFPASVSTPASAAMYQSQQWSAQASAEASLRQQSVIRQNTAVDSSGISTAILTHSPSGGMGNGPDQDVLHFPASVPTPASAAMYQSPQFPAQASAEASLGQHSVIRQNTAVDSLGRSTTILMHNPSSGMGNGPAYQRNAPHFRSFVNLLPASGLLHRGTARSEE